MTPHLILTGFSGTGKSAVARECARLLGWEWVDIDARIARERGMPVERIFATEGEEAFRALESRILAEACASPRPLVIATGGGAITLPRNREVMFGAGVVVCLEARPETILQRLGGSAEVRPLLQGPDPLERIRELKARRQPFYALADWTVHTDLLTPEQTAVEAVRGWEMGRRRFGPPHLDGDSLAAVVTTPGGACPLYAGWGLLEHLGPLCRRLGLSGTAYLVSDTAVFHRYGRQAQVSLEEAGIPTHTFAFPPGEASKTLETARAVYRWLAGRRAERGHFIVAVGGGVVGDLAGFVAATYNRGMPFVQVPTSLAAMVDASIGGKTAVNLPEGKNLVGAFHQPRLVLADVSALASLPPRELASGWAEAIKHGLILDAGLFRAFETEAEQALRLSPGVTTRLVRWSMQIKAQVVSRDERETGGLRTLLNYGHTIGHALEAATGYTRFLHGEAVAIGMAGAGRISQRLGLLPPEAVGRQDRLLARFRLPTRCPGVDPQVLLRAMQVDKKTREGTLRWVLLEDIGRAVVRADVPQALVQEVLEELCAPE